MKSTTERRLARLEHEDERGTVYVVSATLPDDPEPAPGRELTAEEWRARHCQPEGRK